MESRGVNWKKVGKVWLFFWLPYAIYTIIINIRG